MILTVLDVAAFASALMRARRQPVLSFPHSRKSTKQETIMEIIRGKQTSILETCAFINRIQEYSEIIVDIGTGDGRFARKIAAACPDSFVMGIDAARENLYEASRHAPANVLFVIANAEMIPPALNNMASRIAINFPWGSLLAGLLMPESAVWAGVTAIASANALVEVRLNAGALAEFEWELNEGTRRVQQNLRANGFAVQSATTLTPRDLAAFPSTWAKRLAFGRDPRAMCLYAIR
jgi:16S rRNA (adenine(1408)-N(1))-methyltransferase